MDLGNKRRTVFCHGKIKFKTKIEDIFHVYLHVSKTNIKS